MAGKRKDPKDTLYKVYLDPETKMQLGIAADRLFAYEEDLILEFLQAALKKKITPSFVLKKGKKDAEIQKHRDAANNGGGVQRSSNGGEMGISF